MLSDWTQAGHSFQDVMQSKKPNARKLPGWCSQTNLPELSGSFQSLGMTDERILCNYYLKLLV